MFKQFTENLTGTQVYLISSLGIFVIFFIVVTVALISIRKNHVAYMGNLPLEDSTINPTKSLQL
jgi:hypothetical protein